MVKRKNGLRITVRKIKKGYVINVGGKPIKKAFSKLKALEHAALMRRQMRRNPFIQQI